MGDQCWTFIGLMNFKEDLIEKDLTTIRPWVFRVQYNINVRARQKDEPICFLIGLYFFLCFSRISAAISLISVKSRCISLQPYQSE
jgi:hypothetical protein